MNESDLTGYLMAGERLIWWGRPRQGFVFAGRDVFLIPFSLMWAGFSFFWETSVVRSNAPLFFMLWGVPFVLVGLYVTVGRFLFDAWVRRRILYGVTNRRILIVRTRPSRNFTALNIDQLPTLELSEGAGGRGTIRFGAPALFSTFGARGGWGLWAPALDSTPQFTGIEEARNVFNQIQSLVPQRNPDSRQG